MPTELPPADLLPVSAKANFAFRAIRFVGIPIVRAVFRIHVTGRANIPNSGNYIVIANHLGWMDWAALLIIFPPEPRLHFLANAEGLIKRPVEWWLVRTTGGYVPVDHGRHGDTALYDHVYRCLEVGGSVAIFPEGEYGPEEGKLLPFHRGFAHFAIRSGVPVVPVALSGTKELWVGKRITAAIGSPIDPSGHTPESLTALAHDTVAALLPAYAEPSGRKPLKKWLTHLF